MTRMTRMTSIVLVGIASAFAMWWYRTQRQLQPSVTADRGEVIFRNTPIAGNVE
jgi:hypothetical protein